MNKLYALLLVLVSFGAENASAQQVIPPLKKEFLDSALRVVPTAAGARYRRETEFADSIHSSIRVYYLNGSRYSFSECVGGQKQIVNGVFESWYDNGQLDHYEEFDQGKRVGEMRLYYRNGQLKRRARYAADMKSAGECFREDGQQLPFFEYEQMPVYPEGDGGNAIVVYAIQRAVKYPRDALKARAEGRVFASFVVTDKGSVADIRVVESVFPSLDAEVVKAIRQLKPFVPGRQDDRAVNVSFTVPVTFRIQ